MERVAILSDIHGNITALNAVLDDIEQRGIKRIFCLGDYVVKSVHPDLVIDKLKQVCEVMLIGNCDYSICRPEAKHKKFWSREKIGEERANFIFNLPKSYDFYMSGHLIRLFHARRSFPVRRCAKRNALCREGVLSKYRKKGY